MREFSWRYFELTGDILAYLLYKRHETHSDRKWTVLVQTKMDSGVLVRH